MQIERNWKQLLNPQTFRKRSPINSFDGRNPFESDYGRLISSSPFRRLQDKTQVFPLEQSDFIRTRLTHSLEVSYIAGSIGQSIEKYLIEERKESIEHGKIPAILRSAGLVHDLGNPPFGHFGETAIQDFFKQHFTGLNNSEGLDKQEKNDFQNFDGNVQTFRILRKLQFLGDEFSYNLTFPTLASIIKYPSCSNKGNKGKKAAGIAFKKFGYFSSEQEDYDKINEVLGLNNKRHPLVYLLEAADDIAYSAADIEDGVKLGILNFEKIRYIFNEELSKNKDLLNFLDETYEKFRDIPSERLSLTVQRFRIKAQVRMIEAVIDCFKKNYTSILQGDFEDELIDKSFAADIRAAYKRLQGTVFDNKKIIQTELAGWEVINGLLRIFISGICTDKFAPKGNTREARLYKNISSSYRYIYEELNNYPNSHYNKLQLIVDFISGMTDSYALNLYRKLNGIRL